MGQRANLVVLKNGKWSLYYDHWCANALDVELFWGPELATEFIEQRPPGDDNQWLDEVWAEGGAIVDHDRKILCWYGGEDILYDIPARRAYLALMQRQWPNWEIRWAAGGIVELGAYLGVPAERFLTDRPPPPAADFYCYSEVSERNNLLFTVRRQGQTTIARLFGEGDAFLAWPAHLSALLSLPRQSSATWTGRWPTVGLHLDLDERSLHFWNAVTFEAIDDRARRAWPEWQTHWLRDRIEDHLRLSSANIQLPAVNITELQLHRLAEIRRCSHHEAKNPARDIAPMINATDINPWTDQTRGSVRSHADKLQLLDRLEKSLATPAN